VRSDLKVIEVGHLGISTLVEADDFLNECLIVAFKTVTIALEVQNRATLRLDLVEVEVVDAGDLVAGLRALHILALLEVSRLRSLLGLAKLVLDAEIVVTALVLPELLKGLTFEFAELVLLFFNGHFSFKDKVKHLSLESQVRDGELAAVIVTTSVSHLQQGIGLAHCNFNLLPVDLKLFAFGHGSIKLYNQRIVEVLLDQDDFAVNDLVLFRFLLSGATLFAGSLGVSLALSVELGQGRVFLAADFGLIIADLHLV